MGDRRFDDAYERVVTAADRAAAIRGLSDREIIQALAAASKGLDPYLANILASEALNRERRRHARFLGTLVGAGLIIGVRTTLIIEDALHPGGPLSSMLWLTSTASLALGALSGWLTYRIALARLA